jgi:hypothetical protein
MGAVVELSLQWDKQLVKVNGTDLSGDVVELQVIKRGNEAPQVVLLLSCADITLNGEGIVRASQWTESVQDCLSKIDAGEVERRVMGRADFGTNLTQTTIDVLREMVGNA